MKKRMTEAMKAGRAVERDVLRVALSEIQAAENRGTEINDDESQKIIRKLIKSNTETIAVVPAGDAKTKLEEENRILDSLLPKQLGVDEIVKVLAGVEGDIKSAKSEGQATGVAMKHLKASGATVGGKEVAE